MNIARYLNMSAVYWHPVSDTDSGASVYQEPIELPVYWKETHEEYYDKTGTLKVSKAVVLIEGEMNENGSITPDIVEGGVLWQNGKMDNLLEDRRDLPFEYANAVEIAAVVKVPDKNAEQVLIKAYL